LRGPETGLYYYRARYYDPSTGRFLSEDKLFEDGTNAFLFIGNDPIDWVDVFGNSRDTYAPDFDKHGGPHVDRYNPAGQNVGRYGPDGRPLPFKGKTPPPVPNSDRDKFNKAADKLKRKPPTPATCPAPNQKSEPVPNNSPVPVPILPYLPFPGSNPAIPEWPTIPLELPELPAFAM
jgi:hypothetical protein